MIEGNLAFPRLQPQFFSGTSFNDIPPKSIPLASPEPKLIGLTGKARSGKDSVACMLWKAFRVQRVAFADPLKCGMQEMFDLHDSQLHGDLKETTIEHLGVSPRQLLQGISDVWWKALVDEGLKTVDVLRNENMHVVVSDVRCEYAAQQIRKRGGKIWHVMRDSDGYIPTEANVDKSEQGLLFYPGVDEIIVNDGTVEELYNEVCDLF
jgi:hypothetical protein